MSGLSGTIESVITVLIGENSFEVEQWLQRLVAKFGGTAEKFNGTSLELKQLPDLLMGTSLFAEKRLVIIHGLGANKEIWDVLPDWMPRLSDDIHLVLVESKPDRRTKTWKILQKTATVQEFKPWTERDTGAAVNWVVTYADGKLTKAAAQFLVARGGINQWALAQTIDKLSVYDEITEDIIRDNVEARADENVFQLFETALRSDSVRVQEMIAALSQTDDAYQTFGLLSGQVFQLAALAVARDDDDVARDLAVHPFVISKLRPYANRLGARKAGDIVNYFARADETMKTTDIDPWLAAEHALLRVAGQ